MSVAYLDATQAAGSTATLLSAADGGVVRRTVLPGGLRIVTEAMPGVRSASLGVWVGVGSRDERSSTAGASHFLEHLLFKGTGRRSALEISETLDAVGGELNAFTGKEYTCFHARVLDDDLPLAIDVVADMIVGSLIRAEDVESEREVILEEIAMNDDDPDDVVHNLIASQVWGDSPLGRPIAGEPASVRTLSTAQIQAYYRRSYRPESMVVAVAGNVEHAAVVAEVELAFGRGGFLQAPSGPLGSRRADACPGFAGGASVVARATEQANLVLALPGLRRGDSRRHAAGVLNAALGGGMSSRLFQEVREKRGLAYSVYSFASTYADTGLFGVYAGCAPAKVDAVLSLVREQLLIVADAGISQAELDRGKGQLRGSVVLGLEDSGSRMSRIGKSDLLHGELASIDEVIARIDAVTLEEVRQVAGDHLAGTPSLAVVGPFDDASRFAAVVAADPTRSTTSTMCIR
ncbi:MAG: insulinase family protein [Actinomycetota bacterium]|nr:insulinase family protein [Actinomycetota bacterium]